MRDHTFSVIGSGFLGRVLGTGASQRGSHILLEKPVATTLSDADRIIKACADAGVKLLVGQILRFEINYALIQSAIAEGSIGRFLSAYARRLPPITEAYRLGG